MVNDNINALVNQDFKDLDGRPIRNKMDQNYYNGEILNRM